MDTVQFRVLFQRFKTASEKLQCFDVIDQQQRINNYNAAEREFSLYLQDTFQCDRFPFAEYSTPELITLFDIRDERVPLGIAYMSELYMMLLSAEDTIYTHITKRPLVPFGLGCLVYFTLLFENLRLGLAIRNRLAASDLSLDDPIFLDEAKKVIGYNKTAEAQRRLKNECINSQ